MVALFFEFMSLFFPPKPHFTIEQMCLRTCIDHYRALPVDFAVEWCLIELQDRKCCEIAVGFYAPCDGLGHPWGNDIPKKGDKEL